MVKTPPPRAGVCVAGVCVAGASFVGVHGVRRRALASAACHPTAGGRRDRQEG